jgi:hypothetical protein
MNPVDYPVLERPAVDPLPNQVTGSGTGNSLKKLILQARGVRDTLLSNWILIAALTLVGGLAGWVYDEYHYEPPRFLARYQFNLETQSGGGAGFGDFASMFGMGGGPVDNGLFSGENFYILFQSRPMMERTLLRKVNIRGHKVLLANFFILRSDIRKKEWKDNEEFETFLFDPNKPRERFNRKEATALNMIREKVKANLALELVNKKSSIIEFGIGTTDETLSLLLANGMMQTITEYYQTNKTLKTIEILELARKRRDSLRTALYRNESQLASYIDQNQGLIVAAPQVQQQRLQRNSSLASTMYIEALRNVETIQQSLIKETPLVTIIDSPILPLTSEFYPPRSKRFGLILGAALGIAFVMLRRTYRELMKD